MIEGLKDLDNFAITLEFAEKIISGFSGCNNYWGQYKIDGLQFRILGALASTLKMCQDHQMSLEAEFLGKLAKVFSFRVNGDRLELDSKKGKILLALRRTGVEDLLGKWQVISMHLPKRKAIVSVSDVLCLTFRKDFVQGSAGCNTFRGVWGLEGRILYLGPLTTTLKECEETMMVQEKALLDALNSVVGWRLACNNLFLLRSDGGIAVSLLWSNKG